MSTITSNRAPNTWAAWVRQSKIREWSLLATAPTESECREKLLRADLSHHDKLVRLAAAGDPNREKRPR
jgi:hypothetical protein